MNRLNDQTKLPIHMIDVMDPDLFQTNSHHPLFAQLRKEAPVHFIDSKEHGSYWSVTKYTDIAAIDGMHEVFSADIKNGGSTFVDSSPETNMISGKAMIWLDPPDHTTYRGMVSPGLTPKRVAELESEIRTRIDTILAKVPVGEEFNWCEVVADELPMQMLASLFGIPQEDRNKFLKWSNLLLNQDDPDFFDPERAKKDFEEFSEYCHYLWNKRVTDGPGDDLVSMLVYSNVEDFTPQDYIGTMILLVTGGNDTTRTTIAGSIFALNLFPDQYRTLREDRSKIIPAIDEIIRWQTPITGIRRTAMKDTELRGQQIAKGDRVILWYISGNFDEEVFDRPHELIIGRSGPKHLSFGKGIHYCLGSRLAELQLRCLWEALLEKFPRIEVVGEPVRVRSNIATGYKNIPVIIRQ